MPRPPAVGERRWAVVLHPPENGTLGKFEGSRTAANGQRRLRQGHG
jgi:hypothetical protein